MTNKTENGFIVVHGAFGVSVYRAATQEKSVAISKPEEIVVSKESNTPVLFPANPNHFNPIGLVKVHRPGTKNGALISWMDPIVNIEVFRWDENINYPNGSHYHIYGAGHYYPGDIVPEPFASIYFPIK